MFRTKPQIALGLVDRALAHGVRVQAWTFDEAYGRDTAFLDSLEQRRQVFVGEVPTNFHGWAIRPRPPKFPGSISIRVETHLRLVGDILDGMAHSGFRRILIVNGHGGNNAVQQFAVEWAADHPGCRVLFHNWCNAPRTWAKVQAIDPVAWKICR